PGQGDARLGAAARCGAHPVGRRLRTDVAQPERPGRQTAARGEEGGGVNAAPRKVRLRVLDELESSLGRDGTRRAVVPAEVAGRFATARKLVFAGVVLVYAILPVLQIER